MGGWVAGWVVTSVSCLTARAIRRQAILDSGGKHGILRCTNTPGYQTITHTQPTPSQCPHSDTQTIHCGDTQILSRAYSQVGASQRLKLGRV